MKKKENKTDSNTINNSPVLLALKMEEGAVIQRVLAASRSQKSQQNQFSPRASRKENSPADPLVSVDETCPG